MVAEQVHRYPRWVKWPVEVVCTVIVTAAAVWAGRDVLRYLWATYGVDTALFPRIPFLPEIVIALGGGIDAPKLFRIDQLLPALAWLLLALLVTLLLRNSLPTIRTSARGMLVEFTGDWLAIPWESLVSIKVTEDFGAERFVLLAETNREYLTGWHRLYSLIYRFGFRRGILITSGISNFDGLVKTLLSETDRVARMLEKASPARLQEDASSPLFRFLLGPASFFSRRDTAEAVPAAAARPMSGENIRGSYPARISALFAWGTTLLAVILVARYAIYWLEFAALTFPNLQRLPVFDRLTLLQLQLRAPWWLIVAAHLLALVMLAALVALRNLLPDLEARREGLAVRYFNRWIVLPWERIAAIKVTEFSENSQIVLIEARGGLPASSRVSSLIYGGSLAPGILVTSAISAFEPLMQRAVLEVTRHQAAPGDLEDSPLFQQDAYSPLLLTSFRAGQAIDRMVEEVREAEETKALDAGRVLRAAGPMAAVAMFPSLLAFADRAINQALLPDIGLIIGVVVVFLLAMLEWPLVSLSALTLDEVTGGGEEGNRPLYLYPRTQLPRVLPMLGALLATLLGIPVLPVLFWLGAIFWSFLLAAGLWEGLYDWRGGQLLAGGLIPVLFQLLILLAYLFVMR